MKGVGITTLLPLLIALIIGVVLVEITLRRTEFGVALVLGLALLAMVPDLALSTTLGPFRVSASDVVAVILLTAATGRLLRARRMTTPQTLLVLFGAVVLYSMYRGAVVFGVQDSVNEARKWVEFTSGALYLSTLEPRRDLFDRVGRLWLIAVGGVLVVALLRWGALLTGTAAGFLAPQASGSPWRVIPSSPALLLAGGLFITLPLWRAHRSPVLRYAAPVLLVAVVLLQHRTVWVAIAAGFAVLMLCSRMLARRFVIALTASVLVFSGLAFTLFDTAENPVGEQLAGSATSTGTFEWRVEGWATLLEDSGPASPTQLALGRPFGEGWERRFDGDVADSSPHSLYVELFLRVGLLGLGLLLACYAITMRRLWLSSPLPHGLITTTVILPLLTMQLASGITYTPSFSQSIFLGLGMGAVAGVPARFRAREIPQATARPLRAG